MPTTLKFAALLTVLLSLAAVKADPVEIILQPSDSIKKGNQYIEEGDVEAAKTAFTRALNADITTRQKANAYNGLCVAHLMEEQWDEALELCNSAIGYVSQNWRYYNNRGNAYLGLRQYNKAMVDYEKALGFAPKSTTIRKNMALASVHLD